MIWESGPWKRQLWSIQKRLTTFLTKAITDSGLARFERDVMIGAFIVRKLMDANKISNAVEQRRIAVLAFKKSVEHQVDFMNWHNFEKKYSLSEGTQRHFQPRDFCNLIIHSLVFAPDLRSESKGINSIFFNSDSHEGFVFSVPLESVIALFANLATDDVHMSRWKRLKPGARAVSVFKKRAPDCPPLTPYAHP